MPVSIVKVPRAAIAAPYNGSWKAVTWITPAVPRAQSRSAVGTMTANSTP